MENIIFKKIILKNIKTSEIKLFDNEAGARIFLKNNPDWRYKT